MSGHCETKQLYTKSHKRRTRKFKGYEKEMDKAFVLIFHNVLRLQEVEGNQGFNRINSSKNDAKNSKRYNRTFGRDISRRNSCSVDSDKYLFKERPENGVSRHEQASPKKKVSFVEL